MMRRLRSLSNMVGPPRKPSRGAREQGHRRGRDRCPDALRRSWISRTPGGKTSAAAARFVACGRTALRSQYRGCLQTDRGRRRPRFPWRVAGKGAGGGGAGAGPPPPSARGGGEKDIWRGGKGGGGGGR